MGVERMLVEIYGADNGKPGAGGAETQAAGAGEQVDNSLGAHELQSQRVGVWERRLVNSRELLGV